MAKNVYVGIETEIPLEQTYNITTSNISTYFTVTNNSYYFAGNGSTWTSNNKGVSSSTAKTVLTAKQDMEVSFDYSYSSEASYDKFTLIFGSTTVESNVSGSTTNKSYNGTLTAGQTITFQYTKDSSVNKNNDECTFSNLKVTTASGTTKKEVARKVKKMYAGINNKARRVKKGYIGVNGVAHLYWSSN